LNIKKFTKSDEAFYLREKTKNSFIMKKYIQKLDTRKEGYDGNSL
jgi:hypothetical protein